ncbi:trypsin-like serine peptidase [Nocardiopsis xinjiangensis]|uniref:trypsin-like serine peptidase n=1 Tax=Nocardiopsis xinjiangensis TaxID=124285 RepID=UPI00034DE697|nr:trypsin-like serine protease [Nocardiopsis xinjiangensis]
MTPSTTYTLLAPISAAALLMAGLALTDHLPGPASAAEQAAHVAHTPGQRDTLPAVEGVEHRTAASDAAQERAVLDYWTPRRMADATPIAGLVGDTVESAEGLLAPDDDVELHSDPNADSTGDPWTGGGLVTRTTGKVFLTMDGRDFTCSASVVDSENASTLVTAGHCAKDGTGAWAENWAFVPGYSDGEAPHGRYAARDLLVTPQWSEQADDSYDFAMAVVNTDEGETVQDRVGAQDISFDTWTEEQMQAGVQIHAFGYPSASPFDGRELHYCSGPTTPDTDGTTASGMGCEMTQGSSGGPWLTDFDPSTGEGTVSSVVSFKYSDDLGTQYGPRLNSEARQLFDNAQQL